MQRGLMVGNTIYISIYMYTSNYKLCSEPVDIFLYNRKTSIIIKKKVFAFIDIYTMYMSVFVAFYKL